MNAISVNRRSFLVASLAGGAFEVRACVLCTLVGRRAGGEK
jgi:hypothetical protein